MGEFHPLKRRSMDSSSCMYVHTYMRLPRRKIFFMGVADMGMSSQPTNRRENGSGVGAMLCGGALKLLCY